MLLTRRMVLAVLCILVTYSGLTWAEEVEKERPTVPGGMYDKPYIRRAGRGALLGGYMDHEFEWAEDGDKTFDQHRFIPFIYSEITDRIHVSTEIEYEHGGLVKGKGETDGEIKLEFATLDFAIAEWLNFRGGVILSPLGKFNLIHDSPINDLTARPMVDRQIIPTTLSESGMGIYGTLYPTELSLLGYEIYVVNGFNQRIIKGTDTRIRSGRGSQKKDNNEDKAITARVNFSPKLGIDLGASVHTGDYDDEGKYNLTIFALDGAYTRGALDLLGEYARAEIDVDKADLPNAAESQQGYYLQASYHFLHDVILPTSVFTGVVRWDSVDFDADIDGDDQERLTLGLNFRPVEDSVFKIDWQFNWKRGENSSTRSKPQNRFFFSIASYF